MIAWVPLVLALQGTPIDEVRRALGEGRLGDAWQALPEVRDRLQAARAEADLWYFARDFPACLDAVARGLEAAPEDLFLLHRGLSASLWLRDGEQALSFAEHLDGALAAATLSGEEERWWETEVAALRGQAAEFVAGAAERRRLRDRARATSLTVLAGAGTLFVLLSRDPNPGSFPRPSRR